MAGLKNVLCTPARKRTPAIAQMLPIKIEATAMRMTITSATLAPTNTVRLLNRSAVAPAHPGSKMKGSKKINEPAARAMSALSPSWLWARSFPMGIKSQRRILSLSATVNCVISSAMKLRVRSVSF